MRLAMILTPKGPRTAIPVGDSFVDLHATDPGLTTTPDLRGYVAFKWDAMDGWYEEGEEVFVHPHDPYHRIDVLQSCLTEYSVST